MGVGAIRTGRKPKQGSALLQFTLPFPLKSLKHGCLLLPVVSSFQSSSSGKDYLRNQNFTQNLALVLTPVVTVYGGLDQTQLGGIPQ